MSWGGFPSAASTLTLFLKLILGMAVVSSLIPTTLMAVSTVPLKKPMKQSSLWSGCQVNTDNMMDFVVDTLGVMTDTYLKCLTWENTSRAWTKAGKTTTWASLVSRQARPDILRVARTKGRRKRGFMHFSKNKSNTISKQVVLQPL